MRVGSSTMLARRQHALQAASREYAPIKDGIRYTRIVKYASPNSGQTVMVVPTPRFALRTFLKDWIYQRYLSEGNYVVVANDISWLPFVVPVRSELTKPESPVTFLHLRDMPSHVDENIEKTVAWRRTHFINPPIWKIIVPTMLRDAKHPWVAKTVAKVCGHKGKAPAEQANVVMLITTFEAPLVHATLQRYGFEAQDTIEVEVGNDAKLSELELKGYQFDALLYGYAWFLMALNLYGVILNLYESYATFRDEKLAARAAQADR
jgi:hypothetical protein